MSTKVHRENTIMSIDCRLVVLQSDHKNIFKEDNLSCLHCGVQDTVESDFPVVQDTA